MYLDILNGDMIGFADTSAHKMLEYVVFTTYDSIALVDLDHNFEATRKRWDPQQPVETMFKQIQESVDYSEAGGAPIGAAQQISGGYTKIFDTGSFMSDCHLWNEKEEDDKNWIIFKAHLQQHTATTRKCRANQRLPKGNIQPMSPWHKL
jgi:hypothetical protein